MNIKFSVSRASPAGPVILAHVEYLGVASTITLLPNAAREIYRRLGDACLEAEHEKQLDRAVTIVTGVPA